MSSGRGNRRRARELALQILYQADFQHDLSADLALARFFDGGSDGTGLTGGEDGAEPGDADSMKFAAELVRGVMGGRSDIDRRITDASKNWRLERMACVDRNVLRLAVYEIVVARDVPPKVAINEAIEIAKRFGERETPAFINGVLDRILADATQG